MTRYPADKTEPVRNGFYKLYCIAGRPHVGYWDNYSREWRLGPRLEYNNAPMILCLPITQPDQICEWSEWEDNSIS